MKAYLKRYDRTVEVISNNGQYITFEPFYWSAVQEDFAGHLVAYADSVNSEFLSEVEFIKDGEGWR